MAKETTEQEIATLKAEIAKLQAQQAGQHNAALLEMVRQQKQLLELATADRLEQLRLDKVAKDQQEAARLEALKPVGQRTQDKADRLFQGIGRWRVSIPKDKAQPEVEISANSPEEAQARYNVLCGIRSTEHSYDVVPADAPRSETRPAKQRDERHDTLAALHGE